MTNPQDDPVTRFGPLTAPGLAEIDAIADHAFGSLPAEFRAAIGQIAIRVEDFPDEETLADMGIDDPFGLLGLYHGIPLTERSLTQPSAVPDMIFLYRRPLLDAWAETEGEAAGTTLYDLIRHVLIHEIGHHYGFSDADMDRIEAE
ncbi:metallopeptidase family protein [Tistrella bauzanensis]|uniref:Metallopeptidase family protein n=1 Tax=Tistrella arctica TaxID=3133430 RepID=A0ABU9YKI3_9PROT